MIDQTLLNISSVMISVSGLFSVLTKFYNPKVNLSFNGANPYALKRDIIDGVLTSIFSLMAITGFIIQLVIFICGDEVFKERNYSILFYVLFSVVLLIILIVVTKALVKLGNFIAKRKWIPQIVSGQLEIYSTVKYTIENDGINNRLLMRGISAQQQNVESNFNVVDRQLNQIEELLELKEVSGTREERLLRVSRFFEA